MFRLKYPAQTDPPRSPRETLPTTYDLPSEDPEEPGLPDGFHSLQPQLLSRTVRSPQWSPEQIFAGTDINLYYDVYHQLWYKRPDWFLVVGVPRLYDEEDLRLSYVIWQEGVTPLVAIELLPPGTEAEDLGINVREDLIPSSDVQQQDDAITPLGLEQQDNGAQQQKSVGKVPGKQSKTAKKVGSLRTHPASSLLHRLQSLHGPSAGIHPSRRALSKACS